MTIEDRLTQIDKKIDLLEEKIERLMEVLPVLNRQNNLIDSNQLAEKLNRSYKTIRALLNRRIIPSPVVVRLEGRDMVNERLFDEWIQDPENLKKLEQL